MSKIAGHCGELKGHLPAVGIRCIFGYLWMDRLPGRHGVFFFFGFWILLGMKTRSTKHRVLDKINGFHHSSVGVITKRN